VGKTFKKLPKKFDDDYEYSGEDHDSRSKEQRNREDRRRNREDLKNYIGDVERNKNNG
jgi:hypothetical protein